MVSSACWVQRFQNLKQWQHCSACMIMQAGIITPAGLVKPTTSVHKCLGESCPVIELRIADMRIHPVSQQTRGMPACKHSPKLLSVAAMPL